MGTLKAELEQMLSQMKIYSEDTNKSCDNLKKTEKTSGHECECPICHGTGWELLKNDEGLEEATPCRCGLREKEIQDSKLRFATIPETYKDVTFKDFTIRYYTKDKTGGKAVIDAVKYWIDHMDAMTEAGKGLYFWSVTKGCGKTMMAAALANELIHKHQKYVKFATSLDILDEIKATYNKDSEENEKSLLDDLVKADYLIIDDFGTERASDWAGEKFYQIVNRRYIDKKVTFFTSNYDLKNLEYDDRISNRIRERSFTVHFPEESVRELKAMMDNNLVGTA